MDPYLRPLYDALFDMLGPDTYAKYLERGNISGAPCLHARQNTGRFFHNPGRSSEHLKRADEDVSYGIGFNSKAVITGDITQIDLPGDKISGLIEAVNVLKDIDDIGICTLTGADVVRHALVQRIIAAYDKYEKTRPDVARGRRPIGKHRRN